MKDFKNLQSEVYLTNLLRSYLEYNGFLFPTTAKALSAVEEKLKKNPVLVPAVPFTAAEILRNGMIRSGRPETHTMHVKEMPFRAAAARNGSDLPEELRAKMQIDRNNAVNKKPGHEPI